MILYQAVTVETHAFAAIKYRAPLLVAYPNRGLIDLIVQTLMATGTTYDVLLMDSGAYTNWKQGGHVDLEQFVQFIIGFRCPNVRQVIPVNLDVIPGEFGRSPTAEEVEESAKKSFDNFQTMQQAGITALPVFHQGENFSWRDRMVVEADYVGISPANDRSSLVRRLWLDEVFSHLDRNRIKVKTHAFGVMAVSLLRPFPWYSADSASAGWTAGVAGRVFIPVWTRNGPDFTRSWDLPCGYRRTVPVHLLTLQGAEKEAVIAYLEFLNKQYGSDFNLEDLLWPATRMEVNVLFIQEMGKAINLSD